MYRLHRFRGSAAVLFILFLGLTACGGGGGGGSGGGGDPGTAPGMSVNPTSLAFTAQAQGSTPPSQTITLSITASDAAFVLAGVPAGSTLPTWLDFSWGTISQTSAVLNVSIVSTVLPFGTYTATLRVGIARADQSLIAYRDVPVTYTVTKNLSASPAALTFAQFAGDASPPLQTLSLTDATGGSYNWATSVSYQSGNAWLSLSPSSGGSLPAAIQVGIATGLAPGNYNATIAVTSSDDTVTVPVAYTVRVPGLVLSQTSLSFSARSSQTSVPNAIDVSVDTENGSATTYTTDITYASTPGWLSVTGSSAPGVLSVAPTTVNLAPGSYMATVKLTPANGAPAVSIDVSYTVAFSTLIADQSSVSFVTNSGRTPLPGAVDVTISSQPGSVLTYTTSVTYGPGASGWLNVTGSDAPGVLSLVPNNNNLAAATYTATVSLTPSNGSPVVNISVAYVVNLTTLTLSPNPVSFSAVQGEATLPSAINISALTSPSDATVTYTTNVSYSSGASGWLNVGGGSAPGLLSVVPNTTNLLPGTYTATIKLIPSWGGPLGPDVTVNYTLQPSSPTVSPASVQFQINSTSSAGSLQQSVNLDSTGVPLDWTASSSSAWLTVTPSGTTPSIATLTLVPAELQALANGQLPATVTFTFNGPSVVGVTRTVAVSLVLNLAQIDYVAPYVALPNSTDEVILRGSGFNGLGGRNINFGSNAVSTYTVISSSEIHVATPALPIGSYLVQAQNDLGISRSGATLVVADVPGFAETTLSYPNATAKEVVALIYDTERHALVVGLNYPGSRSSNEFLRYTFDAGVWGSPVPKAISELRDLALTTDGTQWLALSDSAVLHVNAGDLTTETNTPRPTLFSELNKKIAVANNGEAVIIGTKCCNITGFSFAYLYPVRAPAFNSLSSYFEGTLAGSADGQRVWLGSNGVTPDPMVDIYSAADGGSLSGTGQHLNLISATANRTGLLSVLETNLGFQVHTTVGALTSLPNTTLAAVFSPDNPTSFVYTYDSAGTLRKFQATTGTEMGTGTSVSSSPGAGVKMAITPDGGTLFLAGTERVVVMPAP